MVLEFNERLRGRVPSIAERVLARRAAEAARRDPSHSRDALLEEVTRFVGFVLAASTMRRAGLLVDYVEWARSAYRARQRSSDDLLAILEEIRAEVSQVRADDGEFALEALELAARRLDATDGRAQPGPQWDASDTSRLAQRYLELLLESKRGEAIALIMRALDGGLTLEELYLNVLQPVMREVGWRWQSNEISVAQEHYVSAVTQLLVSQLYPRLLVGPRNGKTLIATCVASNLHEIGLRFLCDIFELRGWDTHFYGANTPPGDVIEVVRKRRPDIVAVGATLGLHLPAVAAFVGAMKRDPTIARIPILVGGAAFAGEDGLWREMGADGYARDALDALQVADALTAAVH